MRDRTQINRISLPIDEVERQVLEIIYENDTSIILGETGCGKSTQIPQICLRLKEPHQIVITQPRRVAAISLANRVADEMQTEVGDKVGYRVRFENKCTDDSWIVYMTDGMLLREAVNDGLLRKYSIVIVDEAHERSLHTDVLLSILRLAQKQRKAEGSNPLKIVIMSATMRSDILSSYFYNAPIYMIKGRTFPVELFYAEALDGDSSDYMYNVLVTILQVHEREPISDDVLVFLTGREEIELAAKKLRELNDKLSQKMVIYPLYAALKSSQQQKVFESVGPGERKIILSTNIAETSLTIPGVRIVIDSGKVKQKTFTARDGIDVLRVERISKAQAAQRAGRAGREASGKCYRIYSSKDFIKMNQSSVAEILRSNLSSVILELVSMGLKSVKNLKLIEEPSADMFECAEKQLIGLSALTTTKKGKLQLTSDGEIMAKFPIEPPYSKILLASSTSSLHCCEEALTIVSLLSSEELFLHSDDDTATITKRKLSSNEGDHITMLNAYKLYQAEKKKNSCASRSVVEWANDNGLNIRALTNATKVRKQLKDVAKDCKMSLQSCGADKDKLRKAIAIGLYMNACELDNEKDGYRLILSPSTIVRIHPSSVLSRSRPSYIVFSQLLRTTDLYAKDVTVIDKSWIEDAISQFKRRRLNE